MVNLSDQLYFLVISVSKIQALVNVEWKNNILLEDLAAQSLQSPNIKLS